jgi:hypothetical protein
MIYSDHAFLVVITALFPLLAQFEYTGTKKCIYIYIYMYIRISFQGRRLRACLFKVFGDISIFTLQFKSLFL